MCDDEIRIDRCSLFQVIGICVNDGKHTFFGSEQETVKMLNLRGFLQNDELGFGGGEPLRFQQQIVHIAVATATA